MALTTAEQRNAFYGPIRIQVKEIVATLSQVNIGFSNSRMALDDVVSRLCLSVERASVTSKVTAAQLAERYRAKDGFSPETMKLCANAVEYLKESEPLWNRSVKFNKATLFSWLWLAVCAGRHFTGEMPQLLGKLVPLVEQLRRTLGDEHTPITVTLEDGNPFWMPPEHLAALVRLYIDRSTSRVSDVSSVIARDVFLWTMLGIVTHSAGEHPHRVPYLETLHPALEEYITEKSPPAATMIESLMTNAQWGGATMRVAKSRDHWRRACDETQSRLFRLKELVFSDVVGIGTGQLSLHHSLTVICGSNGAGKSTLLSVCGMALSGEIANPNLRQRYSDASVHVSFTRSPHKSIEEVSIVRDSVSSPAAMDAPLYRIDLAEDWFKAKHLVQRETNWKELLEQHGSIQLDKPDLEELSYLVGKDYSKCELYEIDEYNDGKPFPYCVVTASGSEYGFEEMGAGEGALFLAWWNLRQITRPSLLLLEEPETHITPRSLRALLDIVAERCSDGLCCIVTTHSPDILSYVPRSCLRLVVRTTQSITILDNPDVDQLESLLGVESPTRAIILVEDRCAKELTKELLRLFRSEIASRVLVVATGGESVLTDALKAFPICRPTLEIVGVYDGDQRSTRDKKDQSDAGNPVVGKHCIEFLPGSVSPDAWLRTKCKAQGEQIAIALNAEQTRVVTALASCEGLDDHDWIEELRKKLKISYETLISVLMRVILQNGDDTAECKLSANRIAQRAIREPDVKSEG